MTTLSGSDFRAARKALRLTQAELGERLGLSPSTIAMYEAGHRREETRKPVEIPLTVRLALAALQMGLRDHPMAGAK